MNEKKGKLSKICGQQLKFEFIQRTMKIAWSVSLTTEREEYKKKQNLRDTNVVRGMQESERRVNVQGFYHILVHINFT